MMKEDLYLLRTIVNEYGARVAVSGLIQVLREYADEMSDLGLKEQAIEASNVADELSGIKRLYLIAQGRIHRLYDF